MALSKKNQEIERIRKIPELGVRVQFHDTFATRDENDYIIQWTYTFVRFKFEFFKFSSYLTHVTFSFVLNGRRFSLPVVEF